MFLIEIMIIHLLIMKEDYIQFAPATKLIKKRLVI